MVACFKTLVRTLLAVSVLALAAPTADAARRTTEPTKPATADTKPEPADGGDESLDGFLIIAGIVAIVVFAAWVASRAGDNKPHVMG